MITVKTLVRLAGNVDDLCPHRWMPTNATQRCRATGEAHLCVGDQSHKGKHVCPCGALRSVLI